MRVAYRDTIAGSHIWDYAGITWIEANPQHGLQFLILGLLPALWMPLKIRQPSDLAAMIIYLAVYLPIITLLPFVSDAPYESQLLLSFASLAGVSFLVIPGVISYKPNSIALPKPLFWIFIGLIYLCAWILLAQSGRLAISNLSLSNVYEGRLALREIRTDFGAIYHYGIANTMYVFGPFLVAYGLVKRNWLLIGLSLIILMGAFAATTFKSAYFGFFGVLGVYIVLRRFPNRPFVFLSLAFLSVVLIGIGYDWWAFRGDEIDQWKAAPWISWSLFFRIFGNSAFLNAAYFDFFLENEKIAYTQSFMRNFLEPRYDRSIPRLIGELYTNNPENNVNVNLLTDAYANISYWGIVAVFFIFSLYLAAFNMFSRDKSLLAASLLLLIPTLGLTNLGLHTAMLSAGLFVALLMIAILPKDKVGAYEQTEGGIDDQQSMLTHERQASS